MAVPLANVARWDDLLPPPTLDELNALADEFSTRPLHSRDCRENWVCPSCMSVNEPTRNLLMNLPPYACQFCEHKNPTSYAWSMVDVVFNRADLDFMVYNQQSKPLCSIYAATGAVDCAYRVRGALSGVSICAALDPAELICKYAILHKHDYINMPYSMMYEWMDKAPQVLRIVRDHGIALKKAKLERGPTLRRRIRGFFNVDKDNVLVITRLLASGFPLVATMRVGKLFGFLSHDQIYSAPIPGGEDGYHSVVLIGSGTAPRNGVIETFYVARNSHGIRAHGAYHKERYGGDFLVWASDILTVFGVYILDQDSLVLDDPVDRC